MGELRTHARNSQFGRTEAALTVAEAAGGVSGTTSRPFGTTAEGRTVTEFTLTNARGSIARLIDLGATLTELWVPDREGRMADVVLGYDDAGSYEQNVPYFGCTVGRVANRIARGQFTLDGQSFDLATNDGDHHLHGGSNGFGSALWQVAPSPPDARSVTFTHTSHDGDGGYPGGLDVTVSISLSDDDVVSIDYRAACDAPTIVNLTNHTYWNLSGGQDVLDHRMRVMANRYTEVGVDLIPTGRLLPVADTPFDFSRSKPVGQDMEEVPGGYDHNYVLAESSRSEPALAAILRDDSTGRVLRVSTTEPGIQVYSGNFLDGVTGKRGGRHERHAGICLEAQGFPDAVNQPEFPSVVLRPEQTYRQRTAYACSVVA